jgi:LuxR family maltose regulon positive regulatory protein
MAHGANHRLSLISAPAGFGKTTLVVQWLRQMNRPTAWLSIDPSHNNPKVFGVYLVHALHQLDGIIDKALVLQVQSPHPPALDDVIIHLINHIAGVSLQPVLVLDDLHVIKEPAIYQALDFLIANQPDNFHIIVTTREDPPLSLSRLRARGQLREIRAQDLRFTYEETATFLNDMLSLGLDAHQVQTLDDRTEGWVAGLQFAGLSLQCEEDKTGFIQAFSASHRYVLDYLSDEVLRQITPDIREFLLKTSILDRLSADLCNSVIQRDDAQSMLEHIEGRNLFVIRLDHQRQWYRYHHLFADLLRQHLYREYPASISTLHLRASQWYANQGNLADAMQHAQLGNNTRQLIDLCSTYGMGFIMQGYVEQAREWIELLPKDIIWKQPRVLMSYGWILYLSNEMAELPALLQQIDTITEQNDVLGEAAALRAFLSKDDPDQMQAYAGRALQLVSDENLTVRGMAHMALSDVYQLRDERQRALDQLLQVIDVQLTIDNRLAAANALINATVRGLSLAQWNRLATAADAVFTKLEQVGMPHDPAMGATRIARGWIMVRRYELTSAIHEIAEGLDIASHSGVRAWQLGAIPLIQALIQHGERQQIDDRMHALLQTIQAAPAHLQGFLSRLLAHMYIDLGELHTADHWLSKTERTIEDQLAAIRLHIFQDNTNYADMLAALNPMLMQLETVQWNGYLIEALILRAILHYHTRDFDHAVADIEYAIQLAQPHSERYVFMQNMPYLRPVLAHLVKNSYARQLLALVADVGTGAYAPPSLIEASLIEASLIEALSEREVAILGLMTRGLTYDAMSSELTISINTVRYHVKSLYGKLGVSSRADAIAYARKRGLL